MYETDSHAERDKKEELFVEKRNYYTEIGDTHTHTSGNDITTISCSCPAFCGLKLKIETLLDGLDFFLTVCLCVWVCCVSM